jgi:hypothetical protein
MFFAWVDCRADEVTLSRKGAKSRTHGRKLRSSGTKARTRVGRVSEPLTELEKKLRARARELERTADARTRELAEALERETATSAVLNVISRSPSQLQPVLDTIVATAADLCQADFAMIHTLEHGNFRLVATSKADAN